ncbi:glycosyltransferase family 32 protein [Acetobacter oeni]|uniref:Mannosyltransferase n=1 Tax=Acetobacter oeni TaxID=304077 RepID=A0A511XG22_9PROT|nr:capsular polysaccharide synthesis protein [Acetobacter oeni]MBB3882239.1 hypothetical protein [Acetobacter oeni]NHO17995.1 mannosyltransferase [Acetobacter oeni]GBR01240.1 hypothetical protein AA21952_0361 [Acetobacter oeni LMG 21952]GEN61841.1 hypothetical protein AOE01nite_00650 [Acetobacter oeni]
MNDKIRIIKDTVKSIVYGFSRQSLPEFTGWHDNLVAGIKRKTTASIPKIVWFFWDKEEKPSLVSATIKRVQELNPDHEIRFLNNKNISQYIEVSFLHDASIMPQHKSDMIRLELLHLYGGIWCDATCIFHESLDWLHKANIENSSDLIAFYREQDTRNTDYPVIENWFLACPPAVPFIRVWRDEVRKIISQGAAAYFKDISNTPAYNDLRQGITRPEYLVTYLAEQVALRAQRPSFYLRKAEDGPFLYQQFVNWDRERIATILCRIKMPAKVPPVIKLTHSNRYLLPFLIRFHLVRKDSIAGRFLSPLMRS